MLSGKGWMPSFPSKWFLEADEAPLKICMAPSGVKG